MLINLMVGDVSHESHCITETILIESSLTKPDINRAYRVGTRIVGFDFCAQFGREECMLPKETCKKLLKAGYCMDIGNEDEELYLESQTYADIFLFICKLGIPDFKYSFVDTQKYLLGGKALVGV